MTISTPDFALVYLSLNGLQRTSSSCHINDVPELDSAYMIEVEDCQVSLSAVYTRVFQQVVYDMASACYAS